MRVLNLVTLLAVILLAGCDARQRFGNQEDRINAAIPVSVSARQAHERLVEQLGEKSAERAGLMKSWEARLRARAVSCSPDFTPSWKHSANDIRAAVKDKACFAAFDHKLSRWNGVQRVRLMLAQPPLAAADGGVVPPSITLQGGPFALSRDTLQAPVLATSASDGFELLSLHDGRSLFKESGSRAEVSVAPNGRVFAQAVSGTLRLRAVEGGETLLELPDARGVYWLSPRYLGIRSAGDKPSHLLSLRSGEDVALPTGRNGSFEKLLPVPSAEDRFSVVAFMGLYQFDVKEGDGAPAATLVAEKPGVDQRLVAVGMSNGGQFSADGTQWVLGHRTLVRLNLNSLEVRESSFEPAQVVAASPTANPDQFVVNLAMQGAAGGTGTRNGNYLFDASHGTLARVEGAAANRPIFYLPAVKRLAQMNHPTIWLSEQLETGAPVPVAEVLSAMLEESNQRLLAQAAAEQQRVAQSPALQIGSPLLAQVRDAQVEGVGIYEGREKMVVTGQSRGVGRVTVNVRRSPRPLVLVLTSYEPVQWTLRVEPGVRLGAVLLGGYYDSTVLGAGDARVLRIGKEYAYKQDGPEFQALQREVQRWAGRPISLFQTGYHGGSFSVGGP